MRIEHAGTTVTVVWSVLRVFLAMASQAVAGMIGTAAGITQVSENTQNIVNLVKATPFLIVIYVCYWTNSGEIIFRKEKMIFSALFTNDIIFYLAFISSPCFRCRTLGFLKHLLVYTAI